jgi:hypothetical protein
LLLGNLGGAQAGVVGEPARREGRLELGEDGRGGVAVAAVGEAAPALVHGARREVLVAGRPASRLRLGEQRRGPRPLPRIEHRLRAMELRLTGLGRREARRRQRRGEGRLGLLVGVPLEEHHPPGQPVAGGLEGGRLLRGGELAGELIEARPRPPAPALHARLGPGPPVGRCRLGRSLEGVQRRGAREERLVAARAGREPVQEARRLPLELGPALQAGERLERDQYRLRLGDGILSHLAHPAEGRRGIAIAQVAARALVGDVRPEQPLVVEQRIEDRVGRLPAREVGQRQPPQKTRAQGGHRLPVAAIESRLEARGRARPVARLEASGRRAIGAALEVRLERLPTVGDGEGENGGERDGAHTFNDSHPVARRYNYCLS